MLWSLAEKTGAKLRRTERRSGWRSAAGQSQALWAWSIMEKTVSRPLSIAVRPPVTCKLLPVIHKLPRQMQ